MIAKLAVRMAFSRAPGNRWRLLSAVISCSVAGFLVLTAVGIVLLVDRVEGRGFERTGRVASHESPTDSYMLLTYDSWQSRQIESDFVMPASSGVEPKTAPGFGSVPRPGHTLVSPGLKRLIEKSPSLAARYPRRTTLAWSAVADANELLAYRGMPLGDSLGDRNHGRNGPLYRMKILGTQAAPAITPRFFLVAGVVIFLVVPAAVLVLIGLRSASRVRQARLAVLDSLGVGRHHLTRLLFIEGVAIMLPGLVLGMIAYTVVSHALTRLPGSDTYLVPGDLNVPVVGAVSALAAFVTACCLLSVTVWSRGERRTPRPSSSEKPIRWTTSLPLTASALLFFVSVVVPSLRPWASTVAVAMALVGVPLACVIATRWVGRRAVTAESAALHVVGASMMRSPRAATRPYLGVATLILLTLAAAGWTSAVLHTEAPSKPPGSLTTAQISPPANRTDAVQRLRNADRHIAVVKVEVKGIDGSQEALERSGRATIFATCEQLRRLDATYGCQKISTSPTLERQLRLAIQVLTYVSVPNLTVVRDGPSARADTRFLALSTEDLQPFDLKVRNAVAELMPGTEVSTAYDNRLHPNALSPWIAAGMFAAIAALAMSYLLSSVDRHLVATVERGQLSAIGVRRRTTLLIETLRVALPLGVVIAVAGLIGAVVCNNMLDLTTPYPYSALLWTLGAAGIFLVTNVALVCGFGRHSYFGAAD